MEKKPENPPMDTGTARPETARTEGSKKHKNRKRKTVKRIIWITVILLVLGVAGWSFYSRMESEYRTTYNPYIATTGSISNSLSFTGSMQLIHSATYTASADACQAGRRWKRSLTEPSAPWMWQRAMK